jgi:hypothetical protein
LRGGGGIALVIPAEGIALVIPAEGIALVIPAEGIALVIPAEAGIQSGSEILGPRVRGDDGLAQG